MEPMLLRALLVVGLVGAVLLAGMVWRRRDGAVRQVGDDTRLRTDHIEAVGLDLQDAQAGAVLLGSPTCAPCETVKQVLVDVAAERDGFRWVYVDASDHLPLTEHLRVMRVPTLLVLDQDRRIVARTSGVPHHDDLRKVLDEAVGAA